MMLSKKEYWLLEYAKVQVKRAFQRIEKECIKCHKEKTLDDNRVCDNPKCQSIWEKEGDVPF